MKSQANIHDVICTWEERQELFKLNEIQEWEKQYLVEEILVGGGK